MTMRKIYHYDGDDVEEFLEECEDTLEDYV